MLRKGFISKFNYSNNLKAGLNVALLGIPQGMAYALISGLPLYYGLLGSSVAAILGSLTGRSRFITLGPTNATAVLLLAFLKIRNGFFKWSTRPIWTLNSTIYSFMHINYSDHCWVIKSFPFNKVHF